MRVETVHFVFTFDPRLLIVDLGAPLREVIEVLRRSTEVLHTMGIVAVGPVMFFIENGAK